MIVNCNEVQTSTSRNEQGDPLFDQQTMKNITREGEPTVEKPEQKVYAKAMDVLNRAGVPYLVGAAFARHVYTGIWRITKDLDIFLKVEDLKPALQALEAAGFETEIEFEHWLAKAAKNCYVVDIIFGTGHGQIQVEDWWFEQSQPGEILGVQTRLAPVEVMVATGCFVAERSRFDAAEVLHLIRSAEGKLDWQQVLNLLKENWELLLWMLLLFDFVYPGHSDYLPKKLMANLFRRVRSRWNHPTAPANSFRGTLLDPFSFTVDVEDWGYEDRRALEPLVKPDGEAL